MPVWLVGGALGPTRVPSQLLSMKLLAGQGYLCAESRGGRLDSRSEILAVMVTIVYRVLE